MLFNTREHSENGSHPGQTWKVMSCVVLLFSVDPKNGHVQPKIKPAINVGKIFLRYVSQSRTNYTVKTEYVN